MHTLDFIFKPLSLCPLCGLFKCAKFLSFILFYADTKITRRCKQNIQLCFPELDRATQTRLLKKNLWHTASSFLELSAIWYQPLKKILNRIDIDFVDPSFYIRSGARIVLVPHYGCWELLNLWLSEQGALYTLYKPPRSLSADQYIVSHRSRNNARLVPSTTTGLRSLLKGLKNNSTCMILPDQRPSESSAQIDSVFFGIPASTSLLVKRLLDKVDSNVFIATLGRNLEQCRYHLRIESMDSENLKQSDQISADYLNQNIQRLVNKDVSQYQWSYRRYAVGYYKN